MSTNALIESVFSQPDNKFSFDRRTWAGHDEFVVPTSVYQSLKFGRDKHSKWNDHFEDIALKQSLQKVLYSTGKCLITCDTTGASTFLSHQKMVKNLAKTDDMIMSESARSFAVTAIFLAAAGIAGKIDCFASPALMGAKVPLHQGYVIQDTRSKGDYDKTISVLVFNASKNVVGYIKPSDWQAHLQELVFADDITLLTSEIPGMEHQFENSVMAFDSSLEFIKEGVEYEFTDDDTDYHDAVDHALNLGLGEDDSDLFAQLVLCFLKWYNNSDFDVEESFEHAVDEISSSELTVAKNDLTTDLISSVEAYIEEEYSLSDERHSQVKIDTETEASPSNDQKETGAYDKAKIFVHGMEIEIENPLGSVRSGVSQSGVIWANTMAANYGYFVDTNGADGDEVDVFVGPYLDSKKVFVINQVNLDQTFDEHKVMLGFNTENEASDAYHKSFDSNWKGFGGITRVPLDAFKSWVKDGVKSSALNEAMGRSVKLSQLSALVLRMKIKAAVKDLRLSPEWSEDLGGADKQELIDHIQDMMDREDLDLTNDLRIIKETPHKITISGMNEVKCNSFNTDNLVEYVFNESMSSIYVGDDKDSATNAYFKDVCDRWKTSIIKASNKCKVVDWKVKDMFVGSLSMLEMSFDYVNKEGKIEVLLYATDNANAFDVHVTTLGKGGMRQPVMKNVRSFQDLVEKLEWFMLTVGLNEEEEKSTSAKDVQNEYKKQLRIHLAKKDFLIHDFEFETTPNELSDIKISFKCRAPDTPVVEIKIKFLDNKNGSKITVKILGDDKDHGNKNFKVSKKLYDLIGEALDVAYDKF